MVNTHTHTYINTNGNRTIRPRTIRRLDYSARGWTNRPLDCSAIGLFGPWSIRPWTIRPHVYRPKITIILRSANHDIVENKITVGRHLQTIDPRLTSNTTTPLSDFNMLSNSGLRRHRIQQTFFSFLKNSRSSADFMYNSTIVLQ